MRKDRITCTKTAIYITAICFFLLLTGCKNSSPEETGDPSSESVIRENMSDQMMEDGMMKGGMMSEKMHRAMMSERRGSEMMEDMQVIRKMLRNHEKIDRQVENLENGVRTRTTSSDPEIAAAIQKHVRQMKERIEQNQPIRQMDPLFRELFKHADKIEMEIQNLKDGVLVVETSEDPQVVKLIQQHANRAVSEFSAQGMKRAMKPTPLPEGYEKKN